MTHPGVEAEEEMIDGMTDGKIDRCIGRLARIAEKAVKFLLNQVETNLFIAVIV